MTGKRYYMTTLGAWQRHAAHFANSHFIVLDPRAPTSAIAPESNSSDVFVGARYIVPGAASPERDNVQGVSEREVTPQAANEQEPSPEIRVESAQGCQASSPGTIYRAPTDEMPTTPGADAKILVLVEADEGVHLSLEDEPAFEPLPHPLAQQPISVAAQAALAAHGVAHGATTFDAAEAVARVHPLLRHRVF